MHKRCPDTPFSVHLTTPSDTFEAISSKFVRTRIPNSHVYGRRPISAHWANYNDVIGEQPYSTAIMASILLRLHVANPRPLCDHFLHFIVLCFLRKKKK